MGYFNNPQHPYTKGLLACRPPLDKRKFLPTVGDFMQTNEKGENIANDISVEDFTEDLAISKAERDKQQKALFAQEPLLQIKILKPISQ